MTTPRSSGPGQGQGIQLAASDPAVEALLEYLATTALAPPADLTARIQARIAQEPDRTPPRRYLLALLHLRLRTAAGAFRQLVGVAGGRGSFPALMRAQAIGLVLVTVLAAAALGAGAVTGVTKLVEERRVSDPSPHPTRTFTADPTATPTALPSDGVHLLDASPRTAEPTETPSKTPRPSRSPRPPQIGGSDPTHGPSDATPHPEKSPRVGHPEPTRTPRPTPTKTPKPKKTPRPTERPERTDRPEPTETPESGDGGGGGHGPGESEAPDEQGPTSGVWSGDVWLAGLVPPASSGAAEGHV